MNYQAAESLFSRARNKSVGYRLSGRNTRLIKTETGYGIRYVDTIVVEISPKNVFTLNTGGFHTHTTKDRINEYSPARINQSNFVWYLNHGSKQVPYFDGIQLTEKRILSPLNKGIVEDKQNTLKQIDSYVDAYCLALEEKRIPVPGSGDCWVCLGMPIGGSDHLISHMEEGYLVPSLLVNAVKSGGYNPAYWNPWGGIEKSPNAYRRLIRGYLIKSLL